jgi:hypothetical protein
MSLLLFVVLTVSGIVGMALGMNRSELRKLKDSPSGTTHATKVRRGTVRLTIQQYRRAGWTPIEQERLRTPGNKHLVAMTFRKS